MPSMIAELSFTNGLAQAIKVVPGQPFNVSDPSYGVSPSNSDNTAAINAALAAANAAGGGTIAFPPGTFICLGQIILPNNGSGATAGVQANTKWIGSAGHNATSAPVGGTILDLRYSVGREFTDGATTNNSPTLTSATANFTSADVGKGLSGAGIPASTVISSVQSATSLTMSNNATATATGVDVILDAPKIDTRGFGTLEIQGLTFIDGSSTATKTPFIRTTNTTLLIHNCGFIGTGTGTACKNDAIILGGLDGVSTDFPTGAFQGYGTVISQCFFNNIRTGVLGRTFANNIVVRDNNFMVNCGGDSTHAAIQFGGASASFAAEGGIIDSNLIEMINYPYGIILDQTKDFIVTGNGCWDDAGTTIAFLHATANCVSAYVVAGFSNEGHPYIQDDSGTVTLITSHGGQTSLIQRAVQFKGNITGPATFAQTTTSTNNPNDYVINIQQTINPASASTSTYDAVYCQPTVTGSSNIGTVNALNFIAAHAGTQLVSSLVGVNASTQVTNQTVASSFTQVTSTTAINTSVNHAGTGHIGSANGVTAVASTSSTGPIDNWTAFWAQTPSGHVNNPIGLLVSNLGSGGIGVFIQTQTTIALWAQGGQVKFDTGTTFGAFGATPVAQQTSSGNTHTVAAGSTTNVFTNTTFDGGTGTTAYTIGDIVLALKNYGLLKS